MEAGLETWRVVARESTRPPSPATVIIVNPVFTAVEIGFLNPEQVNDNTVPAAISAVLNEFETVKVSVDVEKVHEIVDSRFDTTAQV